MLTQEPLSAREVGEGNSSSLFIWFLVPLRVPTSERVQNDDYYLVDDTVVPLPADSPLLPSR